MDDSPPNARPPVPPAAPPPPHRSARAGWLRKVVVALVAVEALLVLLDVTFNFYGLVDDEGIQEMFNVARELSLGNWFSSVQEAAVGVTFWLVYLREREAGTRGWARRGWVVLAGLFLYVAADDGAQVHERVATAVADFFTLTAQGGAALSEPVGWIGRLVEWFPSYPWQILFGPILGALGLFMVLFIGRRVDRRSALAIYLGLFLFAAAQGQDFVEGLGTPYERATAALGLDPYTVPHFAKVAEEVTEMIGTTIVLAAALGIFARGWMRQPGDRPAGSPMWPAG